MVKRLFFLMTASLLLTGCNKLDLTGLLFPTSGETDQRVQQSLKMKHKGVPQNITLSTDNYRIYVCSDIHTTDHQDRFSEFMRRYRADSTCALALNLGDISNQKGAMMTAADIAAFNPQRDLYDTPIYSIAGNHDLFFGQWTDYKNCFGSSTYTFTVTTPHYRDLYVMLDSGGGCHGKTQMEWLHNTLKNRDQYRHCIICSHVNVFRNDMSQFMSGNLPLEETYELMDLLATRHVDAYLQGHDHHRSETYYGGVRYITLDCLKDDVEYVSYLVGEVGDGVAWQFHDNI